jgi:hypothetical protein
MNTHFWPVLTIGIFLGCILCLSLYGVMLALHNRRKRRERAIDEYFNRILAAETTVYTPSYGIRIVK